MEQEIVATTSASMNADPNDVKTFELDIKYGG